MKRGILLTVIAVFLGYLTVEAQNYDRYNYFHEEAVKLKNEGKLEEAREKFIKIKDICKGGIPQDNDLDRMIRECTTLSVSESALHFEANGGQAKKVTVRTNAGSFRVSGGSDWCKFAKKGDYITVSCDANDRPGSRNSNVLVSTEGRMVSISVTQMGGQLEFNAQPDSVNLSKMSETVEIAITTNALSWRVDSAPDWIECLTSDSTLVLKSEQNPMAQAREATLYIAAFDELFPIYVRQDESDTMVYINKRELVFPGSQSNDYFVAKSNFGQCDVFVSDDWIDVFSNKDTVMVRVQPNESLFGRHGVIKVGTGTKLWGVLVHQNAHDSNRPTLNPEIKDEEALNQGFIAVKSVPSDLKVTMVDDIGESNVRYTPFEVPVDYNHYSLIMGLERRELFANDQQQDVLFNPGMRFATVTWSPKTAVGMMSGFVGAKSWGAYAHFRAYTPFVKDFNGIGPDFSGYSMTFGPVFRYNKFPYLGAYAGVGCGAYIGEPYWGYNYEAGIMGFYKNLMLSMGFHTTRNTMSGKNTSLTMGIGGYLKRYYSPSLGYCASDSRRWFSVNYVCRPAVKGQGVMFGDLGKDKLRAYIKAMYLPSTFDSDSLDVKNVEGSLGILLTPVNGLIDMTLGVSAVANVSGLDEHFQGIGAEVGAILNVWRFPITVMLHESDLLGDRHMYVDFGIGFHFGEFKKSKCSYQ